MRPHVVLRTPDDTTVELGHGDLIGRLWSAALCLADPRISEAHAMVSLRGSTLRLLALRGRFAVGGAPMTELELRRGQSIALTDGIVLTVEEVVMPDRVLALQADGLPAQAVPGVCGLYSAPGPRLVPGFAPDAEAWVWSDGDAWQWRLAEGSPQALQEGDTIEVGSAQFQAVGLALALSASGRTVADERWRKPLRLVARYDTVHLQVEGTTVVALEGVAARILSELVLMAGPVHWQVLAGEVWRDGEDRHKLRRRIDVGLTRLRKQLRDAGVRTDLVRTTGTGHLELVLHDDDEVVDAT